MVCAASGSPCRSAQLRLSCSGDGDEKQTAALGCAAAAAAATCGCASVLPPALVTQALRALARRAALRANASTAAALRDQSSPNDTQQ
jgi:hypothetical protein